MTPEELTERERLLEAREQNLLNIEKSLNGLMELYVRHSSTAEIFEKLAQRLPKSTTIKKGEREKWLQVFIAVFDALYTLDEQPEG